MIAAEIIARIPHGITADIPQKKNPAVISARTSPTHASEIFVDFFSKSSFFQNSYWVRLFQECSKLIRKLRWNPSGSLAASHPGILEDLPRATT